MTPLVVGCFRWFTPGYRSTFTPDTVNVLKASVRRHYSQPHEFVCVTDDPTGLDPDIRVVPLWNDFADVLSPHGRHNPSCYRRLKLFAPEAAALIGPRFVFLDLDNVVTGDLSTIFDRREDFVMYGDTNPQTIFNGSLLLMTAGARSRVWTDFDPVRSPREARSAGFWGSDQAWISYCLGKREAKFTKADGVYSYRNDIAPQGGNLPHDARLVIFHGKKDPWMPEVKSRHSWIAEHHHA